MKTIAVVSFGRKKSERCPNKLLRPFADTTLTDIVLSKIKEFGKDGYFAGFDPEFKEKTLNYGVNFIQRKEKSALIDGPILDIFDFVRQIDSEKILFINACLPFLSIETIVDFLNRCRKNYDRSALAVLKRNNYYFNDTKKALNFDPKNDSWNTKTVKTIYESANALYYFDKEYFLKNGFYWAWESVELVDFEQTYEYIDIDTMNDFSRAEIMWKVISKENKNKIKEQNNL